MPEALLEMPSTQLGEAARALGQHFHCRAATLHASPPTCQSIMLPKTMP